MSPSGHKVTDIGKIVQGNMGEWGRSITYEVEGPFGKVVIVDWESLPNPFGESTTEPEEN